MSHTAFLNALAAVCEATERIPIPRYPPPPNCYSGYAETSGATEAMVPYQPSTLYYHQPEYALPSRYYSSPSPLQNTRVFQQFLDDTWPEEALRRGSAVIRNKLYEKIVETLQGGEATVRFKRWVKKWEFFFMHGESGTLDGLRGACLAVPAPKARENSGRYAPIARHSHKLVARLEDFGQIIAKYHNDQKGHRGIQRTYAMIQEEFSYLPRAAVAKFIELCEVCSQHRPRKSTTSMVFMNKSSVYDMAAAGGSNESFDTSYETSDTSYETFDFPTFDMDLIFPHSS